MHGKQDLLTYIRRTLSYLQTDVSNSNGLRLYDGNIAAEDFYCKLLNLIYGCSLKTLNTENKNFPDVDLIDRTRKLAVQVTSDNSSGKIKKTIKGFFSKDENSGYELWVMLIAEKAKGYEADFTEQGKFSFNPKKHVKDIPRLLEKMDGLEDISDLERIADFLKKEVPGVERRPAQKFYPNNFIPDLKYFVGREELLANLSSTLQTHHKASIHDISGIGKTFACYRYIAKNQGNYSKIFFVNCAKEAMIGSLASLGQMLNPGIEKAPQEEQAVAFKHWLETNEDWLTIYDNVDLPFELMKYVPNQKKGDCVFTSNFADVADLGEEVNIDKLGVEDSRRLLFNRKEGKHNEPLHFKDAREEEYFEKIVKEIDGLPLALSTTGAFIKKKKLKFKEFWRRFEKKEKVIIENEDGTGVYQNGSALRAFLVAIEENTTQKDSDLPRIAELVKFIYEVTSFVSPDNIPEEFLRSIFEAVEEELEVGDADEYWEEARVKLCDYDLFKMGENSDTFSTHRLIQKTIQSQMPDEEILSLSESVLNFLARFFPVYDYNNKMQCERYYQHTLTALENADRAGFEAGVSLALYHRLATYQRLLGSYGQAEKFYQRDLEISRSVYGEEHKQMASSLNNLAMVYHAQGKYDEAVPKYEKVIEIFKKELGDEHEWVATALNNLAGVYDAQGKYDEAIELYEQAIEIDEKTIGKEHPDYAKDLNNLAEVYRVQGRYDEAIELYKQAIEIDEKSLGKEHPDYATHLNNLAEVYRKQGKYDDAVELFKLVVKIFEKVHGMEHPSYSVCLNNMAATYDDQGKYDEAIELYKKATEITENALGKDHPDYAFRLNNLAVTYSKMGKYSEALPLYEKALRIFVAKLPPGHPNIAIVKGGVERCKIVLAKKS